MLKQKIFYALTLQEQFDLWLRFFFLTFLQEGTPRPLFHHLKHPPKTV